MTKAKKKTTRSKRNSRPKLRGPYDVERLAITEFGPSRTKQEFKEECDINNILRTYTQKGVITHINHREPQYGNADGTDFHDAMRIVTEAQAMFDELPSHIRRQFGNDPAELLDFASDPANADQLVEMGLSFAESPQEAIPEPAPPLRAPEGNSPPEASETPPAG